MPTAIVPGGEQLAYHVSVGFDDRCWRQPDMLGRTDDVRSLG
jgi:hypothetical protein